MRVTFSPHLLPVNRGILSTIYVTLEPGWSVERLVELYQEAYAGDAFVHVLPSGQLASLAYVVHTNRCAISFAQAGGDRFHRRLGDRQPGQGRVGAGAAEYERDVRPGRDDGAAGVGASRG